MARCSHPAAPSETFASISGRNSAICKGREKGMRRKREEGIKERRKGEWGRKKGVKLSHFYAVVLFIIHQLSFLIFFSGSDKGEFLFFSLDLCKYVRNQTGEFERQCQALSKYLNNPE